MSRIFRAPQSYIPPPPPKSSGVIISGPAARPVTPAAPTVQRAPLAVGSRLFAATKEARAKREAKLANMHPEQRQRFLAREKAREDALTQYKNLVMYNRHHNKVK